MKFNKNMLISPLLSQQQKYTFHKSLQNSKTTTNENSDCQINYLINNNISQQENLQKLEIGIPDLLMPSHDNFNTKNENLNDTSLTPIRKNLIRRKSSAAKKIKPEKYFSKINPYTKQNIRNNHPNKIIKNDFYISGNNNGITLITPEILYNFDAPNNNMNKINLYQNYNNNLINKKNQLKIQQSNKNINNHKNDFSLENIENIDYNNINSNNNSEILFTKTPKIQCKKKIGNYKFRNSFFEASKKMNISLKQNNNFFNENNILKVDKNINVNDILNSKNKSLNQARNIIRSNNYKKNGNKTNSYINYMKDISFYETNVDELIYETGASTQNNIQNNTQNYTQNNSRNNINNKTNIINSNNANNLINYPSSSNLCVNKEKLLNKQNLDNSFNNNYNNIIAPANHILNYNSSGYLIYDKQKSLQNEPNIEKNSNKFEKTFNDFYPDSKIEIDSTNNSLNNPIYHINNNKKFFDRKELNRNCSKIKINNSTTNLKKTKISSLNKIYKKPEKSKKIKKFNNSISFKNKQSFAKDLKKDLFNNSYNNITKNKEIIEKTNNDNDNICINNEHLNNPKNKSLNLFKRKLFGIVNNNKNDENSKNCNIHKTIRVTPDVKIDSITERYGNDESKIIEDDTIILNDSDVFGSTININNNFSNSKNMNRYFKKYNSLSQAGKEINSTSPKINQDLPIIYISINGIVGFNLFGVLDGHGINGHHVSKFLGEFITNELSNTKEIAKIKDLDLLYEKFKEKNYEIIKNIFLNADKCLFEKKDIDSELSGTTCVIIIQIGQHLISANVGDSRAILIYDENKIFELSHDFKPDLPQEKERIYKMGGIVDRMVDFNGIKRGPLRVWSKNQNYPGLAMSRSIGDFIGKECGIICVPEIIEYNLNENSKYMVICSDGVWEFLSNENVMNIGNKYYIQNDIIGFTNKLIETATLWWEKEDIIIDDITAVIIFF